MKYYVAPLEGITGYVFRGVHHKHFPGTDKYFIPFIEPKPNAKKIFSGREQNDILPEHNIGISVVPQILTNKWQDFLWTAEHLKEYGYKELNLNLGCPSKTVVSKNRGSGFLSETDQLDEFLYEIFSRCDQEISLKTRIGRYEPEEFEELLRIYEKYPVKELIIHPRTQKDFYGNTPNYSMFGYAIHHSRHVLGYNGDILKPEDMEMLKKNFPEVKIYMMGRGILRNPQLIENLQQTSSPDRVRIKAFHDELRDRYREELSGETVVLFKMKEIWCYMIKLFEDTGRYGQSLKKAKHLRDFNIAAEAIFRECRMIGEE